MFISQYGGKFVVNPSGGLEAKGHPLGATGVGMHFYIASKVFFSISCCQTAQRLVFAVQLRNCEWRPITFVNVSNLFYRGRSNASSRTL
jgi:hypothetical protein